MEWGACMKKGHDETFYGDRNVLDLDFDGDYVCDCVCVSVCIKLYLLKGWILFTETLYLNDLNPKSDTEKPSVTIIYSYRFMCHLGNVLL